MPNPTKTRENVTMKVIQIDQCFHSSLAHIATLNDTAVGFLAVVLLAYLRILIQGARRMCKPLRKAQRQWYFEIRRARSLK
jgi:hypothetical protein